MGNRTSVPGLRPGSGALREMRGDAKVRGRSAPERRGFEGFTLDLGSRTVNDAARNEVPLWRSEFALLAAFLRAPGRDVHRMARQPQAALAHVAETQRFAEATHTRWLQAETLRLRGDLLSMLGDFVGAEAS
jgi:DNA-binding response OmpR family regulator